MLLPRRAAGFVIKPLGDEHHRTAMAGKILAVQEMRAVAGFGDRKRGRSGVVLRTSI